MPVRRDPPPGGEDRLVGADRVLAVLTELAEHPEGATLDELANALSSSKPTVHRALVALRRAGLAEQLGRGTYILGDEFLRLAFRHHDLRPETARIEPLLRTLAAEFGETAHYAVLEGSDVVYRAKVDPPEGAMRLTSTIGGRNPAYRTAVGKLLLSYEIETREQLDVWLTGQNLEAKTAHTITDPDALLAELHTTRARGYGIDDQENELGINCLALPVFDRGSALPIGALSISGLTVRCPLSRLVDSVDGIRAAISAL